MNVFVEQDQRKATMSSINELIARNAIHAYNQGVDATLRKLDPNKIVQRLEQYFELTTIPNDEGVVEHNPEWDAGFQAAIAIVKGVTNEVRSL